MVGPYVESGDAGASSCPGRRCRTPSRRARRSPSASSCPESALASAEQADDRPRPRGHRLVLRPRLGAARRAAAGQLACASSSTSRRSRCRAPGIGNYTLGMLQGLVDAGGRHEIVAFAPVGPRGARRVREALDGLPIERRIVTAAALVAHVAHRLEPPRPARRRAARRPARRLPLLGLDVPGAARRRPRDDRLRPLAAAPPRVGRAADRTHARPQVRTRRRRTLRRRCSRSRATRRAT